MESFLLGLVVEEGEGVANRVMGDTEGRREADEEAEGRGERDGVGD